MGNVTRLWYSLVGLSGIITLVKGYRTRVVSCYSNFIPQRMSIKACNIIQNTVSKKIGVT